jgi:carbon-monoxide dehydrogenase medium subunit
MYPDQFDYRRAESVADALDLLAEHGDEEAELLAGGHSLLPTMKSGLASPDVLIDVSEVPDLTGVETDGDATTVGAMTTYADVVADEDVHEHCPAFAAAVEEIGDVQVRNRGTIGGNLAHADPASDLPGAALAADATIHAEGPDGERTIPADEYFLAMYTTALAEDELLTAVEIPNADEGDAGAYAKKASPASGYAMVGVAVRLHTDGETIEEARVGANGAFTEGRRLEPVEEALAGSDVDAEDLAADAGGRATEGVEDWELMEDMQASAEFRGRLLEAYAERAIDDALDRVAERAAP